MADNGNGSNGWNETEVSNQESIADRTGPAGDGYDPPYPYAKGRRLKIITSNSPTVAAKVRLKNTNKTRRWKRD
jgi:hypothetical protein